MQDKTLQATIKLKDQITSPLKSVSSALKTFKKGMIGSTDSIIKCQEKMKNINGELGYMRTKMSQTSSRIRELKKQIKENGDANGELTEKLRQAEGQMEQMKNRSDELTKSLRRQRDSIEETKRAHARVRETVSNVSDRFKKTGAVMMATSGSILGASSKVGIEFEASMSKVQAVMGATPAQLKQLEKSAREAGAKTTKSASEAANALEYMALAGWGVKEAQEALMPVLKLSEAGAMDLGLTSDLVTDSMSALGLEISKIGQSGLNKYLDQVAKTSNSSNTSIQQLMEGLIIVGGTAKNLNVPMEELNAIMGVMANRGLKGLNENSSPAIEKLVA